MERIGPELLAFEANNVLAALGLGLLEVELRVDIDGKICDLIVALELVRLCRLIVVPIFCCKNGKKNKIAF